MMPGRIAAVLNRGLADSTRARELAANLEGRSLCFRLEHSHRTIRVAVRAGVLELADAADDAADATITGGVLALLKLATSHSGAEPTALPATAPPANEIHIEGDADVARQFITLAQWLKPDIEHELSRVLGLTPARLLSEGVRRSSEWLKRFAARGVQSAGDYLAHERRALVPQAELKHQQRETAGIAGAVQRLGERVAALEGQGQRRQ